MNPQHCPLRSAKSHLSGFLVEPYRPFFAWGILYSVLVMGLWFTWLHGLDLGKAFLSFRISPLQTHVHWMLFGFPSFFIFGFLLTAFPKWVNQPQTKGPFNMISALLLFLSQILFLVGALFSFLLLRLSLVLEASLLVFLLFKLINLYLKHPQKKLFDQSFMVLSALFFGVLAQLCFQLSLWNFSFPFYSWSLFLAQYPYLLFLMFAVSYRILPFFTSNLVPQSEPNRGVWTLRLVLLLIVALGFFEFLPERNPFSFIKACLYLAFAVLIMKELFTWQWKKSLGNFLLLSHYVVFFWLCIFLLGKALQIFTPSLFQAPGMSLALQHVFFLGSVSPLIWGISTRVTRGHGGIGFELGKLDYFIFILLQLSLLVRVSFPILEQNFAIFKGQSFYAAFLWFLAFLLWGIRYFPLLSGREKRKLEKNPFPIVAGAQ